MRRNWTPLDEDDLDREIDNARKHSKFVSDGQPRALSARYNRRTRRIDIELVMDTSSPFRAKSAQGLECAMPDELAEVEVLGDGYALHWENLDIDFTSPA